MLLSGVLVYVYDVAPVSQHDEAVIKKKIIFALALISKCSAMLASTDANLKSSTLV